MAIVINGSGTVTGLAVGGLPDGTVDAGTLATNSVDSAAKLRWCYYRLTYHMAA